MVFKANAWLTFNSYHTRICIFFRELLFEHQNTAIWINVLSYTPNLDIAPQYSCVKYFPIMDILEKLEQGFASISNSIDSRFLYYIWIPDYVNRGWWITWWYTCTRSHLVKVILKSSKTVDPWIQTKQWGSKLSTRENTTKAHMIHQIQRM